MIIAMVRVDIATGCGVVGGGIAYSDIIRTGNGRDNIIIILRLFSSFKFPFVVKMPCHSNCL